MGLGGANSWLVGVGCNGRGEVAYFPGRERISVSESMPGSGCDRNAIKLNNIY